MRRIISVVGVMTVMAAMLVVTAAPALAQIPPNCERGQTEAAIKALQRGDDLKYIEHVHKLRDCLAGQPPGEGQ